MTTKFEEYAENHFMTVYGEASPQLHALAEAREIGTIWPGHGPVMRDKTYVRTIAEFAESLDAQVRAAQFRPQAVPQDYLLAHQEYAPTTQIQGLGPSLRTISAVKPDARP